MKGTDGPHTAPGHEAQRTRERPVGTREDVERAAGGRGFSRPRFAGKYADAACSYPSAAGARHSLNVRAISRSSLK